MKGSKRFISAVLVALLLISVVPGAVWAVDENPYEQYIGSASFSVSTAFCATNKTTKIFVDVSKDSQMSAALFVLKYDPTLLKAINVDTGVVLKNGYTSKHITNDGLVKVSYADVNPSYEAGRLFEVEFEAIGTIPDGKQFVDVPVELYVEDLRNYEDYKIRADVTSGRITLIDTLYGDINQSDAVTATDALMALCSNSQLLTLTEDQKMLGDVNGDGKVSSADALLTLQYSAEEISNYPIFTMEAPKGLNVIAKAETHIQLGWDAVKNVVGYNIYMDGKKLNSSVVTDNQYTVEGLQENSKHIFAVTSVNVLKESAKSGPITVSTNTADRYVTFKDYDGKILNTQIVQSGHPAIEPPAPARAGYSFVGWDKDTSVIYEDTVFVAQYQINTYSVTFDYQYNGEVVTEHVLYHTYVEEPALIKRTGYTLEGWYRDKNFVQKWDFESNFVERSITLYAKWVTWSEWTTDTSLLSDSRYEVQSKMQYSYSDKSTKDSTDSSMSGWISDGSTTSYGSWTNAGWTKTKPTASDTLQITDTKTVTDTAAHTKYHYHYYRYWNASAGAYYYTFHSDYGGTYKEYTTTSPLTQCQTADGVAVYGPTNIYYSGELWFLKSTENVPAVTHTEWYYQTRTKTVMYHYYKWTAYSAWSDNVYTESDTRQVQTRTVYRYRLKQQ